MSQRARSRAQLLIFVRPGCGPCSAALDHADAVGEAVAAAVQVSVVARSRTGQALDAALALEPRVTAVDVGDRVATQLGLNTARPAAALIGVGGAVFDPAARGRSQIIELLDTVPAAADVAAK